MTNESWGESPPMKGWEIVIVSVLILQLLRVKSISPPQPSQACSDCSTQTQFQNTSGNVVRKQRKDEAGPGPEPAEALHDGVPSLPGVLLRLLHPAHHDGQPSVEEHHQEHASRPEGSRGVQSSRARRQLRPGGDGDHLVVREVSQSQDQKSLHRGPEECPGRPWLS